MTDVQAASLIRSVTDLEDRQAWQEVEHRGEETAEVVRDLLRQHRLANNGGNGVQSEGPKVNGVGKQRDGYCWRT